MIITLLKTAIQNLKKIQQQMLPFLKLIIETYADMMLVQNNNDKHGCNLSLMGKLLKRSETFIGEIKKMLLEYKNQKAMNFEIQKKIIGNNFSEFEETEIYIQQMLNIENWFSIVQTLIDNFYNDENVQKLDKVVEEVETQ